MGEMVRLISAELCISGFVGTNSGLLVKKVALKNYSAKKGKYKHVFFDLDRTLWDFDRNTASTLREIVAEFNLTDMVRDVTLFIELYNKHNDFVWGLVKNRQITKEQLRIERFRLLFNEYGVHDKHLIKQINDYYLESSPNKPELINGSLELLDYLKNTYTLHIITNGFHETQLRKLNSANIGSYFTNIYTSEKVRSAKPQKFFFEYVIKSSNARKRESIVIGDDIVNDIEGAIKFNIDQIWFNPVNKRSRINPTFEVNHLVEITNIL